MESPAWHCRVPINHTCSWPQISFLPFQVMTATVSRPQLLQTFPQFHVLPAQWWLHMEQHITDLQALWCTVVWFTQKRAGMSYQFSGEKGKGLGSTWLWCAWRLSLIHLQGLQTHLKKLEKLNGPQYQLKWFRAERINARDHRINYPISSAT